MRWLAVLVVVGLAARAAAQPASATKVVADKEFAEGQAKYVAGDFQGAAEKFKVAYELVSDPVYLFNIAQAYRLAKLCAQAADYYQQFIQASPDPASRDKAARFRDEMTECAKSSALAPQIPPPPSPPAAPPPHSEPAAPTPVAETPSVDDRGHALRVAGLSAGAVGVVALGVAVVYSVKLHDVDRYLDGCHAHPGSCQYSGLQRRQPQPRPDRQPRRDRVLRRRRRGAGRRRRAVLARAAPRERARDRRRADARRRAGHADVPLKISRSSNAGVTSSWS